MDWGEKPQFNRVVKCLVEMKYWDSHSVSLGVSVGSPTLTRLDVGLASQRTVLTPVFLLPMKRNCLKRDCCPLLVLWSQLRLCPLLRLLLFPNLTVSWRRHFWPKPVGPRTRDLLHVGYLAVLATYHSCELTLFWLRKCVRMKKRT